MLQENAQDQVYQAGSQEEFTLPGDSTRYTLEPSEHGARLESAGTSAVCASHDCQRDAATFGVKTVAKESIRSQPDPVNSFPYIVGVPSQCRGSP